LSPPILTRRPNEVLCIGDDVRITVLSVNGAQVRLGIQAPPSVAVDCEEIHERKRAEAQEPLHEAAAASTRGLLPNDATEGHHAGPVLPSADDVEKSTVQLVSPLLTQSVKAMPEPKTNR